MSPPSPQGKGKLLSGDPIELVLRESVRLPCFPDALLRLDEEMRSERVDFARIAQLVGMDPVLSGQILRLANSSWYAAGGTGTQDLGRAMIRLGLEATRDLVHALLLRSLFPGRSGGIDIEAFWNHSFGVALFSRSIGRQVGLAREPASLLWTAALLHDIGALLYDFAAPDAYGALLKAAGGSTRDAAPLDFPRLEREWLGADHAAVGSAFLERVWNMPAELTRCVHDHETPMAALEASDSRNLVLILQVADMLCEQRGVGWTPRRGWRVADLPAIWEELGLPESAVGEMQEEVDQALQRAQILLGESHRTPRAGS